MQARVLIPLLAVAATVIFGARVPTAPTAVRSTQLVDCTCYDLVRADSAHAPRIVLRNAGTRGWNIFDVSAERTRVLYSRFDLYIARVDGSGIRFLAPGYVYNAQISPDGRHVAYSSDACGLCVVDTDGTHRVRFSLPPPLSRWASWSRDSQRLAFAVYESPNSGRAALTVADRDGTDVQRVTALQYGFGAGTSLGIKAAWSPTDDRIAYVAGAPFAVHIVRLPDGRDLRLAPGRSPVWSPDGRRLVFTWDAHGVATINADGTHAHVLDPKAIDPYGFGAAWSPRGRSIAYPREGADGNYELASARPAGTHRRRLAHEVKNVEIGPIYWAVDGGTILYSRLLQIGE